MSKTLPPLPEPHDGPNYHTGGIALFTDDQMQAYARQAVELEQEACAKVCANLWDLREDEKARMHANKCAAAIRARSKA